MPKYYHTNWTPQFGDPILPPKQEEKTKRRSRRGSWRRPSRKMKDRERAKCKITRIDMETGEILEVVGPTSHARTTKYGSTGRAPHIPKRP